MILFFDTVYFTVSNKRNCFHLQRVLCDNTPTLRAKGVVSPTYYIDQLMEYIHCKQTALIHLMERFQSPVLGIRSPLR